MKETETRGSAIEALAGYYLFLGKLQSGMMLTLSGLQPDPEAIYRHGLVKEMEGYISEAKMFYRLALDRYPDSAGPISREEIIESLSR